MFHKILSHFFKAVSGHLFRKYILSIVSVLGRVLPLGGYVRRLYQKTVPKRTQVTLLASDTFRRRSINKITVCKGEVVEDWQR